MQVWVPPRDRAGKAVVGHEKFGTGPTCLPSRRVRTCLPIFILSRSSTAVKLALRRWAENTKAKLLRSLCAAVYVHRIQEQGMQQYGTYCRIEVGRSSHGVNINTCRTRLLSRFTCSQHCLCGLRTIVPRAPEEMTTPALCSMMHRLLLCPTQEVAEYVASMARRRAFDASAVSLDSSPIAQVFESSLAVFIVSTTGDGEVPSNMSTFWRFLLRR